MALPACRVWFHRLLASRRGLLAAPVALTVLVILGCEGGDHEAEPIGAASAGGAADLESRVRKLCGTCHLPTPPEILPKRSWAREVEEMYSLLGTLPEGTDVPPKDAVTRYFVDRAPREIVPPPSQRHLGRGVFEGVRVSHVKTPIEKSNPAISFVRLVSLFGDDDRDLLFCDMRHGVVGAVRLGVEGRPAVTIGRVAHPGRARVVDLDGDGIRDVLVANLGSFLPADHDQGSVVWFRGRRDGGFDRLILLEKVGRVADVSTADMDGDGDLDLAVAVFGWRSTGSVLLLENLGGVDGEGRPRYLERTLDERPGAIDVVFTDVDADGRLDLVVLLSQHFESVIAFVNTGGGELSQRTIFQAPHPDWGSSGIEVADLDGDGDIDVAMVNGDTLDNSVVKPFHGVRWLENRGEFPFVAHELGALPGAHKVRAVDLDGDGDLDLAASSFLPQFPMEVQRRPHGLESVVWFEQTAPGIFERRALESFNCDHPSLDAGDVDGDGDADIVVGNFSKLAPLDAALTVFESPAAN